MDAFMLDDYYKQDGNEKQGKDGILCNVHTWDAADALGCDSHSNALSRSSYAAESG